MAPVYSVAPSPIIPIIRLLLRSWRRGLALAHAHGTRPDGVVSRLSLVRKARELVPEALLGLVQRHFPLGGASFRALNELVESILCILAC